jgi:predicted nuclease of restriction endonuclease-like RecB superfamily
MLLQQRMKKKKTSKYRSKLEERVADLLQGLGISYEYESTKVPYTIQHNYCPDFILPNHVYLETKGYWDPNDRRKVLAVKRDNPDLDLRMVFQAPYNKINKKSKTTYAQWCEKHDIPWTSYHNIPLEWLI